MTLTPRPAIDTPFVAPRDALEEHVARVARDRESARDVARAEAAEGVLGPSQLTVRESRAGR